MQLSRFLMVSSAAILFSAAGFGQSAADTTFQVHYFSNLSSTFPGTFPGLTTGTTTTAVNVTNSGASIGTTFAVSAGSPVLSNSAGPCSPYNPCSTSGAPAQTVGNGNICVNAYVVSPDEELQSCCTCWLTPNALGSWDAVADLTSNAVDGTAIPSGVIKLVATLGGPTAATSGCDATLAGQPTSAYNGFEGKFNSTTNSVLAPGMLAWSRGQLTGAANAYTNAGTESAFLPATLTSGNGTYNLSASSTGFVALGAQSELSRLTGQCAAFISGKGICKGCRFGGL
jgi:hypothetical protein